MFPDYSRPTCFISHEFTHAQNGTYEWSQFSMAQKLWQQDIDRETEARAMKLLSPKEQQAFVEKCSIVNREVGAIGRYLTVTAKTESESIITFRGPYRDSSSLTHALKLWHDFEAEHNNRPIPSDAGLLLIIGEKLNLEGLQYTAEAALGARDIESVAQEVLQRLPDWEDRPLDLEFYEPFSRMIVAPLPGDQLLKRASPFQRISDSIVRFLIGRAPIVRGVAAVKISSFDEAPARIAEIQRSLLSGLQKACVRPLEAVVGRDPFCHVWVDSRALSKM